jgi:hypothetical protein
MERSTAAGILNVDASALADEVLDNFVSVLLRGIV